MEDCWAEYSCSFWRNRKGHSQVTLGTKHIMLFFSSYINCGVSPGEGGTGSKNHVKKLHSILIGMQKVHGDLQR